MTLRTGEPFSPTRKNRQSVALACHNASSPSVFFETVQTDPDERLLAELMAGSPAAFEQVYVAEKSRLYGFLVRLAGDQNVAADLFQNVWLKLVKHCGTLRPDTNLRAWLFTVARHELASYRRAQALDLSRLLTLDRKEPALAPDPAPHLSDLAAALSKLSERDREVLLLTSVEGLTPEQGAQALGCAPAALRQRLARARQRLGLALSELALEPDATCPERAGKAGK